MKPTQGKCEDCQDWTRKKGDSGNCAAIGFTMAYWTGCIGWKPRRIAEKEGKG
jgi:hypothetical protein